MSNKLQNFIVNLLSSLGLKRKLANLFQVLSAIISTVPAIAKFAPLLQSIASYLGVVGFAHAAYKGTLGKNVLSSVAALFSALLLAVPQVPALLPYAGLIQAVATLLSLVVHTNLTPSK